LAAAVELVDAGQSVTVIEAARTLGGRARRVEHAGTALDNGLHVVLGAYRDTLRLVRRVRELTGERESGLAREPLAWNIVGRLRVHAWPLPAPFHLAAGLLAARGPSLTERLRAARFMRRLRAAHFQLDRDTSVAALLDLHGQGPIMREFLWEPLCMSALNTRPAEASAQIFLNVLRDGLHGRRADSDLLLPTTDLTSLFPEPAARYVSARGGKVLTGIAVLRVEQRGAGFLVETSAGRERADAVVCALPAYRVAEALSGLHGIQDTVAAATALRHDPIYSVYSQYSAEAQLPRAMIGLGRGLTQWAFDRGRLGGPRGLVGCVISARGDHQDLAQDALAQRVHAELSTAFRGLGTPLWTRVIAEKRATFACTVEVRRPSQRTSVPGVFLAGDYTAGPYPATLESAVRSGVACAKMALEHRAGAVPHSAAA
jgi:squalene-associated FAD-dependent desaturase